MSWLPKQNVLVPLDFSDFSFQALETAVEFVEELSELHVVHVLPELSPMEPGVIWGTVDNDSRRDHVVAELKKKLTTAQYNSISIGVRFGNPANEIAAYAKEIGAELVVVHSHGRTPASHVLLGSVAERVVRLSPCPVVVLKD